MCLVKHVKTMSRFRQDFSVPVIGTAKGISGPAGERGVLCASSLILLTASRWPCLKLLLAKRLPRLRTIYASGVPILVTISAAPSSVRIVRARIFVTGTCAGARLLMRLLSAWPFDPISIPFASTLRVSSIGICQRSGLSEIMSIILAYFIRSSDLAPSLSAIILACSKASYSRCGPWSLTRRKMVHVHHCVGIFPQQQRKYQTFIGLCTWMLH